MQDQPRSAARRPAGSGHLEVRTARSGRETWYGKWRIGERQIRERIGPRRSPLVPDGLTKRQAERELARRVQLARATPVLSERPYLAEAGERYIVHVDQV